MGKCCFYEVIFIHVIRNRYILGIVSKQDVSGRRKDFIKDRKDQGNLELRLRFPENASRWWTQGDSRLHTVGSHLLDHKTMDKAFNHNKILIKHTQSSKNANRLYQNCEQI